MNDSQFLEWVADRFVYVHDVPADAEYVKRLRELGRTLKNRRMKERYGFVIEETESGAIGGRIRK